MERWKSSPDLLSKIVKRLGEKGITVVVDRPNGTTGKSLYHMPGVEPIITKTGKVLNDTDIQALADEAEAGYDVSHLARNGNSGGPKNPFQERSVSYKIAASLMAGEMLRASEVRKRYGCSDALLGLVLRRLRREGFQIESDRRKGEHRLAHISSAAHIVPNGKRPVKRKPAKRAKKQVTAPETPRSDARPAISPERLLEKMFPTGVPIGKVEQVASWLALTRALLED